jgi:hypothetical protein
MSGFTVAWLVWGLAFAVIEGVALVNSRRGDTLSEHVWAWLGTGAYRRVAGKRGRLGYTVEGIVTPTWTLRLARLAVATLLVWLLGHFLTGGALW